MVICQAFVSRKRPYKLLFICYKVLHILKKYKFNKPGDTVGLYGFMVFHRPSCVTSTDNFSPEVHFERILPTALWMNAEKAKNEYRQDN